MLKYLIFGVLSAVFSFLLAGMLPRLCAFIMRRRENKHGDGGYGLILGCALAVTFAFSAVISLIGGYGWLAFLYLIISLIGVIIAVHRLTIIGRNGTVEADTDWDEPSVHNGDDVAKRCCSGAFLADGEGDIRNRIYGEKTKNGVQRTDIENTDETSGYDQHIAECLTTYNHEHNLMSVIEGCVFDKLRLKVIICLIFFAVSIVIFALIGRFTGDLDVGNDGDVLEAEVFLESVTVTDEAVFLTADSGAEIYALFGYAMKHANLSELTEAVDAGGSFTVSYTVMDRDEWSGYYRVLGIEDENGASLLDTEAVISARAAAVAEKLLVMGVITVICGIACCFYIAVWIRSLKKSRG